MSSRTRGALLATLCLAAAGLVWPPPAPSAATAAKPNPGPSLAVVLKHMGGADRAGEEDLAWIALSEMLDAYDQMLVRARQFRRSDAKSRAALRKWLASTDGYLAGLRSELRAVESGASIALDMEPDGSLLVLVDGRPTVVSGPNLSDPGALGRRIVATFCASHDCPAPDESAAMASRSGDATPPPPASTGHWSFADNRATRFETQQGIAFEFSGFRDRSDKQAASDQLAAELQLLAQGLRDVQSLGQRIDWGTIQIVSTPDGQDPRVILNRNGDFLYLPVPRLANHPELLREARPWIAARMEGRPYELVLTQAERLVHPSDGPGAPTQ
jgi:hypothetical protein